MIDKQYLITILRQKQEGTKGLISSTYGNCISIVNGMPDSDQSRHIADLSAELEEYQDESIRLKEEYDATVMECHNLRESLAMKDHKIAALRAEIGILGSERLLLRELLKDQLTRYAEDGK